MTSSGSGGLAYHLSASRSSPSPTHSHFTHSTSQSITHSIPCCTSQNLVATQPISAVISPRSSAPPFRLLAYHLSVCLCVRIHAWPCTYFLTAYSYFVFTLPLLGSLTRRAVEPLVHVVGFVWLSLASLLHLTRVQREASVGYFFPSEKMVVDCKFLKEVTGRGGGGMWK